MIQRIKKIKQTGVFTDCIDAGKFNFENLTIIYGFNAHGKTTLKELFTSINSDDTSAIKHRKTIPLDNTKLQEIELDYGEKGVRGTTLSYSESGWKNNSLAGKIQVFDNDFMYKNLIDGQQVTRQNRECLTDFILGEEGVQLTDEIKGLNQAIRQKKEEFKSVALTLPKELSEAERERFTKMQVNESKDELLTLQKRILQQIDNLDAIAKIKELPEIIITKISILDEIEPTIVLLNELLTKSYMKVETKDLEELKAHIADNTTNVITTEKWIGEGTTKHLHGKNCPYCSQSLDNVESLINIYKNFFNDKFEKYTTDTQSEINKLRTEFAQITTRDYTKVIEERKNELLKYKVYQPEYSYEFDTSKAILSLEAFSAGITEYVKAINKLLDEKESKPHISLEKTKFPELQIAQANELTILINNILGEVEKIAIKVSDTKKLAGKDEAELAEERARLNKELGILHWKIRRLENNENCVTFLDLKEQYSQLERDVAKKTQELEDQQSEYLNSYFTSVNAYYKKFGNGDFDIRKKTDNRGDKKVYYLEVIFHGQCLDDADVASLMSESEKRSLALAVFLSKINKSFDKQDKIVVLDDPVASFDANRCGITIDMIKVLKGEFNQVIILTHYPQFTSDLIQKVQEDVAFLSLQRNSSTASFSLLDQDLFVESPLNISLSNIIKFINRTSSSSILDECRTLMEKYLCTRYRLLIVEKNINTKVSLNDLIDVLHDNGAYDDSKQKELHTKREGLNPSHHNFSDPLKIEDFRTYARELVDLLYSL